ncbi:MAG: F0F1 ATP synthase subunit A [Rhodothermaceae bacterium]|nr:F0F1 ATP synthase subunit A [Rhodothermaceae bacterium]
MPRLFVIRDADGGLGLKAFANSKKAIDSDEIGVDAHGVESHGTDGIEEGDDVVLETQNEALVTDAVDGGHAEGDDYAEYGGVAPYYAHLVGENGNEIVLDLSPTRHLMFALLAILLLSLLFLPMAGKYKKGVGRETAPRGLLQNMMETVILYVRDEIARPNLGDKTNKYLPYLLTVFFFILTCNLLGLVPFGATATANISTTVVLALFTFVVTQFAGTKDYWGHIFNPPGVPVALKPILIPIEFLGIFTKPFALAIRLFANMTAGHLIILNLIGLIFIIGNTFGAGAGYGTGIAASFMVLFVYALEVLVAFIQAYVFTILSALFIGMASAEHEHDHDHAEDHGLTPHDVAVAAANGQAPPPDKLHERTVGTEVAYA